MPARHGLSAAKAGNECWWRPVDGRPDLSLVIYNPTTADSGSLSHIPQAERLDMRSFVIASAVLVGSSMCALGADAPNLAGNWTRTAVTMVLSKGGRPAKPLFIHDGDEVWKIKIDAQESGSFSGTTTGYGS